MGLVSCRAHLAKAEGFVISHSELDPYQYSLLYLRVITSSPNGFSSEFTAK